MATKTQIPDAWTAIAVRDRFPPVPFPDGFKVEQLWVPIHKAPMTIQQAHDAYLDGRIFKALHYHARHITLVVHRRVTPPKITPRAAEKMRNTKRFARVA